MAVEFRLNQQRYVELKQDLISTFLANLSETDMKNILNEFQNTIKSPRTLNHIKGLDDLVKVLEARNILSSGYVMPLERIAELTSRPNALKRIQDFVGSPIPRPDHPPPAQPPQIPLHEPNLEKVCDSLGRDWRNLARNLGCVNEREIQEIEKRLSCDVDRTREVLSAFQRKCRNEEQECIKLVIRALGDISRHQIVRQLKKELPHLSRD